MAPAEGVEKLMEAGFSFCERFLGLPGVVCNDWGREAKREMCRGVGEAGPGGGFANTEVLLGGSSRRNGSEGWWVHVYVCVCVCLWSPREWRMADGLW